METRTRLGHYEILSAIGKGGMGEVWRARDTRLGREVAIKTLPEVFARDTDRLARFEREAKLLASLNHPNIAVIHGLEELPGQQFLVLELVEGDTLAERLQRGPILVPESLGLARQIVEAIEAAHERGVVHRDLKPANIKVTPEGTVKVLDFGLAKAFEGDKSDLNVSHSPTLSLAATLQGVILGTAAYMSPEQARGVFVDKRADIWAFGCVLYEMLTGSRAFGGELVSDVMASVLKSEPDYSALPPDVSPRLRALLERCLQKDPRKRWRDAGDVRAELDLAAENPAVSTGRGDGPSLHPSRLRERALWSSAILIAIVATGLVASRLDGGRIRETSIGTPGYVARFSVSPPERTSFYAGGWIVPIAVSPNGRWLAFTATSDDGRSRLWVRPLDSETAQVIAGTEDAVNPLWSPDSQWLGFQSRNVWYRVRVPGGTRETISTFRSYTGSNSSAAWGDAVIVYVATDGTLTRVSIQGGQPAQLTSLDSGTHERGHAWPQFLSDGRHFLYLAVGDRGRVYVDSIDGGQRTLVMEMAGAGSTIRYVPGYLFYVENMVLWAQPFDETTRRLTGERRRVTGGLPGGGGGGSGAVAFSVSQTGVLAYWTQTLIQQAAQLQWMDRTGRRLGLVGSPAVYDGFDLSKDESKLVTAQVGRDGTGLWVRELAGGSSAPVRADPPGTVPVWTPDGTRLVYLSSGSLYLADPTGAAGKSLRLTDPSRNQLAQGWTASGDRLVYEDWGAENGIDLVVLDRKTKRVERLGWNTSSNEFGGRLSPADRWLAYVTDQSGQNEVWVAAFPSGQPRRRISNGTHPAWKGDGTELYFISDEGNLAAVPFSTRDTGIEVGTQITLFRMPGTIDIVAGSHNLYTPSRDGQRFLVAVKSEAANVPPISVILNWPGLLDGK